MREEGTVIVVRGGKALVRMSGKGGCEGCCACSTTSGCEVELEAAVRGPVEKGSRVIVEVSTAGATLGALLLFVLPLVGLVGGVVAGQQWQPFGLGATGASLVLGFGLLAVLFAVAIVVERRVVQPRLPDPMIVEVLR